MNNKRRIFLRVQSNPKGVSGKAEGGVSEKAEHNITSINNTTSKDTSVSSNEEPITSPLEASRDDKKKDTRVHHLIAYYAGKFHGQCGFAPTINWGAWGAVFKRHLKDCDQETIEVVIDKFFAYPKRTKFSIYDFDRSFDNTFAWARKEQGRG